MIWAASARKCSCCQWHFVMLMSMSIVMSQEFAVCLYFAEIKWQAVSKTRLAERHRKLVERASWLCAGQA